MATDRPPPSHRRWWHSFEEDHDHIRVYRPDGYAFPPARGRRGIELGEDGTVTEFALGRGDTPQARPGTRSSDEVSIVEAGGERMARLVHIGPDRLELDVGEDI